MCGIAGFRSQKYFANFKQSLRSAALSIEHRGPDDFGFFDDEKFGVGLAHRRLSIIDLSDAGRQPMASEDGRVQIVYNGEVYNFQNIRTELANSGHTFRTGTDTEVILKAYLEWGVSCLKRFVGMFAIAIWDACNQSIILARDRLGIKPLFYHHKPGSLLFASEIKALVAFEGFRKAIDLESVSLFLHYQYIPTPRTIFEHTFKLPPGHFLIYNGQQLKLERYWEVPVFSEVRQKKMVNEERVLSDLEIVLETAVRDRLISDVPLGALLSGGIDSSLVVALMQKVSNVPVRTFTIGFRESEYNEAFHAAQIAKHLGTEHTELYITPKEALAAIPLIPDIYDEPFADSSAIPTLLVCRLARSRITVALSGDGGDEQFCGYVRYWITNAIFRKCQHLPKAIKRIVASILEMIPGSRIEKCYLPLRKYLPQRYQVANFEDKWLRLSRLLSKLDLSELYRMTICLWPEIDLHRMTGLTLADSNYERIFEETSGCSIFDRLMRVDQGTYLPDAMLTKVDRASMAASLEVRVPLLDHRVVEYTSNLPANLKFRHGEGKYILKRLLERFLPKELFERPKMGFGIPLGLWFRHELKELLLDYLAADRLGKEGLFKPNFVSRIIKEHLSGQVDHQYRLWPLLIWQMWRERWMD